MDKQVTIRLTEDQLSMVMRALSHHMADLVDDEGALLSFPFTKGQEAEYYEAVRRLYFRTFNPAQEAFHHV